MKKMGVNVIEHPKGSNEIYLLVCYNYNKRYIKIGTKSKRILTIANQKKVEIEALIAKEGKSILNKLLDKSNAPTLKEFVNGWSDVDGKHLGWLEKIKKKKKYSTWHSYELILDKHILNKWGDTNIDKIDRNSIDDFIYQLPEKGLKPNTIANIKNAFSGVLKEAVKNGFIKSNPVHGIEIPKQEEVEIEEPNPFSWEERDLFENKARELFPRYFALIVTGFRTGMRMGELIGLEWGDIDLNKGVISIRHNITRGRKTSPKTETSKRLIRMSSYLKEILKQHKKAQKEEALRRGWKTITYVFVNETGVSLSYSNFLSRAWNSIFPKIEPSIIRRTPHDMRHTYATLRLSSGHPVHEVAKELGHSSPLTTYKIYYKFIPDQSTSNIDEIDRKKVAVFKRM